LQYHSIKIKFGVEGLPFLFFRKFGVEGLPWRFHFSTSPW